MLQLRSLLWAGHYTTHKLHLKQKFGDSNPLPQDIITKKNVRIKFEVFFKVNLSMNDSFELGCNQSYKKILIFQF